MITPSEPSISLRSWLANNSKFGVVGSFFEIVRTIKGQKSSFKMTKYLVIWSFGGKSIAIT
jgi:hypothetical protein